VWICWAEGRWEKLPAPARGRGRLPDAEPAGPTKRVQLSMQRLIEAGGYRSTVRFSGQAWEALQLLMAATGRKQCAVLEELIRKGAAELAIAEEVKYGKEFELQVGDVMMRGTEAWWAEDELTKLISADAPAKGWAVHSQGQGSVTLSKPRQEDPQHSEDDKAQQRATAAKAEWEAGMLASAKLPNGLLVCARCELIDRTVEMHGISRCGSSAARSSIAGRATFCGPFYQRKCNDFRQSKKG
jgi:hypothetical protein